MDLQDSVQRSLQNPAEKNPADLHSYAKIENLGHVKLTALCCRHRMQLMSMKF